ncbi:MAG: restriction endonuclease subunit S [Micropruina sp.]|nr:restriction endonuclease subunit S [Micropruina sp.]
MKLVPLGEVATIERRGVDPGALPPETAYLGLEHLERGGRIIGRSTVAEAEVSSTKFRFSAQHVLFGKLRPNLGKISRPDFDGVCSTDILPIRPGGDLDKSFLAHYLSQPSMVDFAAARSSGANLPRLSPIVLAQFPVPLPPLCEQRRIAAILDHADALRAKRRQVLAHLDALPQAIYLDMFGDPERTSDNILLGAVANFVGGRSIVADDAASASDYRVLKISAVTSGYFKPWESKPLPHGYLPPTDHLVRSGDLLMSRANTAELVGAVAHVDSAPANLALPDKVWRFVWKTEAEPTYWHALLRTPAIRRRISGLSSGTGGSMKNVAKAKLDAMLVPKVELHRQREFAERAHQASIARATATAALAADDLLFASLQSRAFRGAV